jgi:hypothetical protein
MFHGGRERACRRRSRIARIRHVTHFWKCSQGASVKLALLTPYKGASFIAFMSGFNPDYRDESDKDVFGTWTICDTLERFWYKFSQSLKI